MKLVPLSTLFNIEYGNQFDLSKMTPITGSGEGINFISRASKNFGIMDRVVEYKLTEPYPPGLITVTLGGSYLLASFVQPNPFYTAQNIKVLSPKKEMSFNEKLFYCLYIRENRYRYSSHGREANVSLDSILVPYKVHPKIKKYSIKNIVKDSSKPVEKKKVGLKVSKWKYFNLSYLFDISSSRDELISKYTLGGSTPYITSSELNNAISAFVEESPTNNAKTITANRGGSVGEYFYQPKDYLATPVDVRILTPKININQYIGLFLVAVLRKEKYRFNYARKMGTGRLEQLRIKLPSKGNEPDFKYMENYIKSLPYSSSI